MLRQQKAIIANSSGAQVTAQPQGNTWADRNPGKPVQLCRKRAERPKTTAEKETARLRSETMLENAQALQKEIKAIHGFQDQVIQELAKKYKKKEDDVRNLILSKPILKSRRAVSITNALLHQKAKELNDGKQYAFLFHLRTNTQF
jgi:hypothetical protein